MRKLIVAIVLFLGIFFVIAQFAELEKIIETLRGGLWQFIALAGLIELVWFWNIAASYYSIYRSLKIYEKLSTLFLLSASANFVNVIAPTIGMGGMAVFIDQARRRGNSTGRVTVAGVLFVLFEYTGVLILLVVGLFVLFRTNHLSAVEILAASLLLLAALGLAAILYLGMYASERLGLLLAWAARSINRLLRPFTKREFLSEEYAHRFAHDSAQGLQSVREQPAALIWPLVLSLSSKMLLMFVLYLCFRAFNIDVTLPTLVAGFSIAYLFTIISPTPSGIGFVEGALTLTLNSFQIALSSATVITLAYRGITFWLPLLIGMLSFRKIATNETEQIPEPGNPATSRENGV